MSACACAVRVCVKTGRVTSTRKGAANGLLHCLLSGFETACSAVYIIGQGPGYKHTVAQLRAADGLLHCLLSGFESACSTVYIIGQSACSTVYMIGQGPGYKHTVAQLRAADGLLHLPPRPPRTPSLATSTP